MRRNIQLNMLRERLEPLISQRFKDDPRYRKGHMNIINPLPYKEVMGVHIPKLKELAAQIVRSPEAPSLLRAFEENTAMLSHEETIVWGLIINKMKISLDERLDHLSYLIPKMSNWAECDTICCNCKWMARLKPADKEKVWNWMGYYWRGELEFEVRFAIVLSMCWFLTDDYLQCVFSNIYALHLKDIVSSYPDTMVHGASPYYVRMAVAWLLATSLAKYETMTREFVDTADLPDDIVKMYIRKVRDSRRTKDIKPLNE